MIKGKDRKKGAFTKKNGNKIVLASRTSGFGGLVKNGIFMSSIIPGEDNNGNWSAPKIGKLDIEKEKLTDEMTIYIKYLGRDIKFKLEKMKGDE